MKYGKRSIWRVLKNALGGKKSYRGDAARYTGRIELTNEVVFRKVDRLVREKKLYLDKVTINDLAYMTGTNRTYISRAMKACSDGFVNYMTRVRVENLHSYIIEADEQGRILEDGEDMAVNTGFTNKRSMQRAVRKIYGRSLNELIAGTSGETSQPPEMG